MPIQLPEIPPNGNYSATIISIDDSTDKRIVFEIKLDIGYEKNKIYNLANPSSLAVCVDDIGRMGYTSPMTLEGAIDDLIAHLPVRVTIYLKDGLINSIRGKIKDVRSDVSEPIERKSSPDLLEYAYEKSSHKIPQKLGGRCIRAFDRKDLIFIECNKEGEPRDPAESNWGLKACENFTAEFGLSFWEAWAKRDWRYRYNSNKGWAEWEKS